jgi:hypothetical protein
VARAVYGGMWFWVMPPELEESGGLYSEALEEARVFPHPSLSPNKLVLAVWP